MPQATPARCKDSAPVFSFPAVGRKKVTAAFDGGRLTSDGGVLLLAQAEREMAICGRPAACIADQRDLKRPGFSGGSFHWAMQPYRGSRGLHSNCLRPQRAGCAR